VLIHKTGRHEMEKKTYEKPELFIVEFQAEESIASSGVSIIEWIWEE
jgi:hypothetical protein